MQFERILQSQGFGSRKVCRALIRQGRCAVQGVRVEDPFSVWSPEHLVFSVDGVSWTFQPQVYVMLNKPANVECSRSPRDYPGVLSLLPPPLVARGIQPVGRLDVDTTGLLLLSDDGAFIHAMTSPRRKVPKVYAVTVRHVLTTEMLSRWLAGVVLHDDPVPVAALAVEQVAPREVLLTIAEGRYHQVKRMVAAVGNRVEALCRVGMGRLALPADLPLGAWRYLTAAEWAVLQGEA